MDELRPFTRGSAVSGSVLDAGEAVVAAPLTEPAQDQPSRRGSRLSVYALTAGLCAGTVALVWWGPLHGLDRCES